MPGKVFKLLVNVGEPVKAGVILLSTEAMKMETNIKAKEDCTVVEFTVKEGGRSAAGIIRYLAIRLDED